MAATHRYILSEEAKRDMELIFDYSLESFGYDQSVRYLSKIEIAFQSICLNPYLGRPRADVMDELRSVRQESHIIFIWCYPIRSGL